MARRATDNLQITERELRGIGHRLASHRHVRPRRDPPGAVFTSSSAATAAAATSLGVNVKEMTPSHVQGG